MSIMSNRVIFSLVFTLFFVVTLVYSYDPYRRYGPRDESPRQVRRCRTCPADCSETLASPWYESPTVYSQPPPFQATNINLEGLQQQASYSTRPRSDSSSNLYGNRYFGTPLGSRSNARLLINGKDPTEALVETAEANRFNSIESRDAISYGYNQASSASSYIPEVYQEIDNIGVVSRDNHCRRRHYGNTYKDTKPDEATDEESLGLDQSNWKTVSFPLQQSIATYENPERMICEGRLKAVETPSQKKVFVIYRADADETIDDDDLDRSLISTPRQQHYYPQNIDCSNFAYSMTDSQLEELVRRAIVAVTKRNINRDAEQPYDYRQGREVNYNEHERNTGESYNPRRPYNNDIYQRFNPEDMIEREEKRKIYSTGFEPSEVVHKPKLRYNPYVLPKNEYLEKIYIHGQPISKVSQQEYDSESQAQQELDAEKEKSIILVKLRKINRKDEEAKNDEDQEKKRLDNGQDLGINYRTHSRTTDDNEDSEEKQEKTSEPLHNKTEENDQESSIPINPDLEEEMEIPPTESSNVELQLSFESVDNTTPAPTD